MQQEYQTDKIATIDWVADNLNNAEVRIIEIGDLKNPDVYNDGHIPGAILWPWQESLWHATSREFVSPKAFAERMKKSGIGHDTTVVLYSSLCQYATYAFWILTMRGHPKIKVFNGNRNVWIETGRPLTREIPRIEAVDYPIRETDESCRIGRDGVLTGLENSDRILLDMRTPEEYNGKRVSPKWFEVDHGATRKGHIPGARHLYYVHLLNDDETFKPVDSLRGSYADIGATPDKEIVFYCRLSHRGTLGWFIARHILGYPRAKVYDGSWTEWGSMVGMPIVNESLEM